MSVTVESEELGNIFLTQGNSRLSCNFINVVERTSAPSPKTLNYIMYTSLAKDSTRAVLSPPSGRLVALLTLVIINP